MRIKIFKLVAALAFLFCNQGVYFCPAQEGSTKNIPFAELQSEVLSTNGAVRFNIAEKLAQYHNKETFIALLKLLKDKNEDISYAAANSIEMRRDKKYDSDLIDAIKALPRDNRWPAYWAAASYPTPNMFKFFRECINEEVRFQSRKKLVNCDNCFYLAKGLIQIAHNIGVEIKLTPPVGEDLKDYQQFAKGLETLKLIGQP
jgi:hypothetical protein